MSQILLNAINNLTTRFNTLISNSKGINQLPPATTTILGTDSIPIFKGDLSVTQKTPLSALPISTPAQTALGLKVDKVTGFSLTKNDFTDALKSAYDSLVSKGSSSGGTSGRLFYPLNSVNSNLLGDPLLTANYKVAQETPSPNVQSNIAITLNTTNGIYVPIQFFVTDIGRPNALSLPAGTASRNIYAQVSAGSAHIHADVIQYKTTGNVATTGAISLVFNATAKTITRVGGSFLTDGFTDGCLITISGTLSNNGSKTISPETTSVTATVIYLANFNTLVNETVVCTITTKEKNLRSGNSLTFLDNLFALQVFTYSDAISHPLAINDRLIFKWWGTKVSGGGTPILTVSTEGIAQQSFIQTTLPIPLGVVSEGVWRGTVIEPAFGGTGVANNAAMTVTGVGAFAYIRRLIGNTDVTFPVTGTLATLAGVETFTNKLISGSQITSAVPLASTVTTNANLTGVVTSVGNATAIADAALSIAKTSGLQSALDLKAPLASPTFTGVPTAPTPTIGDNTTKIATTAFVTQKSNWTKTGNDIINDNIGEVIIKPGTKLSILNASNIEVAKIGNNGIFTANAVGGGFFGSDGASGMYQAGGNQLTFRNYQDGFHFEHINQSSINAGTINFISLKNGFNIAPTSGTCITNVLNLSGIINQTGGANGVTRALYINPTLTSAFDFRAIEVTGGKVIIPNGTANNEAINLGQTKNLVKDVAYGQTVLDNHRSRVLNDLGTSHPSEAAFEIGKIRNQGLLNATTLIMIPANSKVSKLHSIKPSSGAGDFTVVNASTIRTRINSDGLLENSGADVGRIDYTNGFPELLCEGQATQLYELTDVMATQTKTTTAVQHTVSFYGTGTINFTGTFAGSLVGTGVNNRVTLTFTATAGSLVSTVVGSVTKSQLEIGSVATSYIPNTTTGTFTRLAGTKNNNSIVTELLPYTIIENNNAFIVPKMPTSEYFLGQQRYSRIIIGSTTLDATPINCVWASRIIANGTFTMVVSGIGTVYWGDGTTSSYSGTGITLNKIYNNFDGIFYVSGTLTYFECYTLNARHNIASLPSGLTFYQNTGANTTSGNIASLPSGLTFYRNRGSNTTSGSISSLPTILTLYDNQGSNTTSGSIASLPTGLTYYNNQGSNTTSGSISSLPSGVTFYFNTGLNQVNQYTAGRVWANNMNGLYHYPATGFGLTSAMVDNLLIDLAVVATWVSDKTIDLRGNNAVRTSASAAAVTNLVGKGVSVLTN